MNSRSHKGDPNRRLNMPKESEFEYHEFDVVKEYWNKYRIEDGTILRFKTVLVIVRTPKGVLFTQGAPAQMLTHDVAGVIPAPELYGTPDTHIYHLDELERSVAKPDLKFDTISEDWNEYYFSGTDLTMSLKPAIISIDLTSKFNNGGEPIYFVRAQPLVKVRARRTQPPSS